ncbi:unnamed protein product [Closterium sp. Naga37s-1]|nr:unnamed protein product [Closterium sp. Naga37s-1]
MHFLAGDCWAYAVVGSIEAALGILANTAVAPVLSVEQLKTAMKVGCSGSTPSQAFQLLLKLAQQGGGLMPERQWTIKNGKKPVKAGNSSPLCVPLMKPLAKLFGVSCDKGGAGAPPGGFPIRGFESTSFYGWFGLLLAVQRQPVVVHIEASAASFKDYDGLSKYQDPACFTYNLNHVVLLVGYRLVGKDSRFLHMAPPFWIIRNSWGPDWGDGGHMRMDIEGGGWRLRHQLPAGPLPSLLAARLLVSSHCSHGLPILPFPPLPSPSLPFPPFCFPSSLPIPFHPAPPRPSSEDACKAAKRNPCAVGTCTFSCAPSTFSCARVCIRNTLRLRVRLDPALLLIARVHLQFHSLSFSSSLSSCPSTPVWVHAVSLVPLMPAWVHAMSLKLLPRCVQPLVSCADPIPPSTVLKVSSPASLIPCSVFYTTQQVPTSNPSCLCANFPSPSWLCGDTCAAVAEYFQVDSSCPSVTCTAAFQALNPSLDCTANGGLLQPEHAVCVERKRDNVGLIPVCSQNYLVQSAETCKSIRNVPYPPLSPIDFFRLNPGMKCNRLISITDVGIFTGFEGTCPRANAYVVGTGDRCTAIQVKYFRGIKGCYRKVNGYDCIDKLIKATRVCLPDKVKLQKGVCDN